MSISITMQNDVKIIICQQAPSVRADSLVIRLNLVCTALGVAFAGQLHHFGPLVKATELVALGGIVVIALALYLGVVILVLVARHIGTDIQVFRHHGHRSHIVRSISSHYRYVVIAATIARIRKCFITTV